MKQVALYIPANFDEPTGIRYVADVEDFDVVERSEIKTPWAAGRDEKMILYRLGPIRLLPRMIPFLSGDWMPAGGRWTTRLGLERARTISEIALETEPEWRLLEWLRATQQSHTIRLDPPRLQQSDNPKGRAWFHINSELQIRYDGVNGFLSRSIGANDRFLSLKEIIHGQLK